jgi:hypothetical protein
MRTMAVVMIDVDAENALELAAAGDQDLVQALAPHRADKALGVGVRLGRLDRRSYDLDVLAAEDLIEGPAELESRSWIRKRDGEARSASDQASWRACCATHAPLGCQVQPTTCTLRLPSSMKKRT